MKKIDWRDILWIGRGERNGILAILLMACMLLAIIFFFTENQPDTYTANTEEEKKAWHEFLATVKHTESQRTKRFKTRKTATVVLAAFDPNTADSATFVNMGLPTWVAGNILKYRAKGGVFRKPSDFGKIYGITKEKFLQLEPYITLAETAATAAKVAPDTVAKRQKTPEHASAPKKFTQHTVLDLNQADTTQLKRIPGIGSRLAWLIVDYRKQLGGYHNVMQLSEIKQMPDSLMGWFKADSASLRKLNLNRIGIERLKAHPYFNFYQAKIVVEHRRRLGRLKSLQELALYEEFTEADLARMHPYVCFE